MTTAICTGSLMEYEQVWRYIVELRRAQKISQEKMAKLVGVSRNGWQDIERGKTDDPGTSVLLGAIRILNASFDDVRELARADATAQDALSRAAARIEQISEHGLASRIDSQSLDELRASLLDLEEELTQATAAFPRLSGFLARLRGDTDR